MAETQQEHVNGLDAMQRQLAQTPGHAPASPTEIISAVDLQQLKTLGARGNASAQNQLGQLYANGRGMPQDYATAQGWYAKAAAQGHAWAQNQLGQLSADGLGVPQDYKKARQWWEQAAAQGVAQAQYNLGQLYTNGRGVPQDYTTARGWYEKSAAQGNAWAQAQLALLYANGRGVPQDYTKARGWYEKPPPRATRGRRPSSRCCSQRARRGGEFPKLYSHSPPHLEEIGGGGFFYKDFELAAAVDERGRLLRHPLAVTIHQPFDDPLADPNERWPAFCGRIHIFKMGRSEV